MLNNEQREQLISITKPTWVYQRYNQSSVKIRLLFPDGRCMFTFMQLAIGQEVYRPRLATIKYAMSESCFAEESENITQTVDGLIEYDSDSQTEGEAVIIGEADVE